MSRRTRGSSLRSSHMTGSHFPVSPLSTGGGTLVTVGVANVGAFLAITRAGFGQFGVGAGVLMHIGMLQPRAWGTWLLRGA